MTAGGRPEARIAKRLAAALPFAVFALLAARFLESVDRAVRRLRPRARWCPGGWPQGERLYRDVQFHHGPLAPYLGAGSTRSVGPSLPARTALAAAIALLHLVALVRLARRDASAVARRARRLDRGRRRGLPAARRLALPVQLRHGARRRRDHLGARARRRGRGRADALAGACLARRPARPGPRWVSPRSPSSLSPRAGSSPGGSWRLGAAARSPPPPLATRALGRHSAARPCEATAGCALLEPPEAFRNVYRAYAGLDRPACGWPSSLLAGVVLVLRRRSARRRLGRCVAPVAPRTGAPRAAIEAVAVGDARSSPRPSGSVRPRALAETARALSAARARRSARSSSPPLSGDSSPPAAPARSRARSARRRCRMPSSGWRRSSPRACSSRRVTSGPYDAFFLPLPLLVAVAGALRPGRPRGGRAGRAASATRGGGAVPSSSSFRVAALADLYRRRRMGAASRRRPGRSCLPSPSPRRRASPSQDLGRRLPAGAHAVRLSRDRLLQLRARACRNPFLHEQFFPGHLERDAAEASRRCAVSRRIRPTRLSSPTCSPSAKGARVFGEDYLRGARPRDPREHYGPPRSTGRAPGRTPASATRTSSSRSGYRLGRATDSPREARPRRLPQVRALAARGARGRARRPRRRRAATTRTSPGPRSIPRRDARASRRAGPPAAASARASPCCTRTTTS